MRASMLLSSGRAPASEAAPRDEGITESAQIGGHLERLGVSGTAPVSSGNAHDMLGRGEALASNGDVEPNPGPVRNIGAHAPPHTGSAYSGSGLELAKLTRVVSRMKRVLHVRIVLERGYGAGPAQLFFAIHEPPDAYELMSTREFARRSTAWARLGHSFLGCSVQCRTLGRGDGLLSHGDVESNPGPTDVPDLCSESEGAHRSRAEPTSGDACTDSSPGRNG